MAGSSLDITAVIAGINKFTGELDSTKQAVTEGFRKTELLEGKKSEVYKQVSEDAFLVTMTQQMGELNARAATLKAANAAGISDPSNPAVSDALVTEMSNMRQGQTAIRKDLVELKQKTETKFFESPVEWIKNNWFGGIDDTVKRTENDTKLLNVAATSLTQLNQGVTAAAQVNNHIKQTVTEASAAAAARMVANEATAKSIEAEIAGVRSNIQGVQAVAQLSSEQLNTLFQGNNAIRAEKQLGIAYSHLALSREQFEFSKQERQLVDAARAEGKQIDDYTMEVVNASRAATGLAPLTGVQAKAALQVLKSGKSSEMAYHYENGSRIKSTGQSFLVGTSPAETIEVLDRVRSIQLPEQMKATAGLLQEAKIALANAKNVDTKDPNARAVFLNNFVKQRSAQYYGAVTQDEHNPYFMGDISSYLSMTAVRDLPVTKMLGQMSSTGQPLSDPKVVIGLVLKAQQDGILTSSQASDLSKLYQVGTLTNQAAKGLRGLGIVSPNDGKNYNVKLDAFGSPVDLANPTALARYMNQKMSLERFKDMKPQYGIGAKPAPR